VGRVALTAFHASGYEQPAIGTYAEELSAGLFQPVPTTAEGAAVNVGANKVFRVPVGVYVGSKEIWVPEKDGEMVAGGNVWEAL